MKVVDVGDDVNAMISSLMEDLGRDDLVLVERLPYVREFERYRDVVRNILREFHMALVLVRLAFMDGTRKRYVFLVRGDEGEVGSLSTSGNVEGYVIVSNRSGGEKRIYRSVRFSGPEEVVGRIIELARAYRRAEERISELRMMREAERDYALFYEEIG
jgi:hypothetical protein